MNFFQLKKNLKKTTTGLPVIKVAILCDFASQLLVQALEGYGIESGVKYDIFEADYNQIDRQILDPASELYAFSPSYVIILKSPEKLLKEFYKTPQNERGGFAQRQSEHLAHLYQVISSRLTSKVLLSTYPEIDDNVFGNFATKLNLSFIYQVKSLNLALMNLSQQLKGLFLADFDSTIRRIGMKGAFDAKMFISADMIFSLDVLPELVKCIHDIIQAINGRFKKCLILDLDNTTWGGIIGDDGVEGIQVGDLGIGKAFTGLQWWAKELKNRGVLLAVCSKNTEAVAKEPFERHPDMVLRLSDIAIFVANWENKVSNIRHIQSVLNISFDSMVFLDDNPFEREMVKQAIPDITVPELPEDPSEYLMFLRGLNLFETASYTEEDQDRTGQYQMEAKRAVIQQSFANEDEFLESLLMTSMVRPFDDFTIPRVAQLSQRSNQFNLRTIRFTQEEIGKIAVSPDYLTLSFTLQDNLGDNGLISVVILEKQQNTLFINTWIMSCRVLKRGMENFVLNTIVDLARSNGFAQLAGEYIATSKNGMVKNHYPDLGFSGDKDLYLLNVADYIPRKTFIKIK
ncbi:MAG: HAD-IIIC family phosphatase [Bacteroidota bacterium]